MARPPRINAVHDIRDGQVITIADAVVDLLAQGNYVETACHIVNLDTSSVYEWLRTGARANEARLTGARRRDLTPHQRRCLDFALRARAAMASSEANDVARLNRLAEGGIPQVRTVTVEERIRDADGDETGNTLVKTTTTVTHTLPDSRAITWRLAHRFPSRWGALPSPTDGMEDPDTDDLDSQDPVSQVEEQLAAIHRRRTEALAALEQAGINPDQVIDTTATYDDTPAGPGDTPL